MHTDKCKQCGAEWSCDHQHITKINVWTGAVWMDVPEGTVFEQQECRSCCDPFRGMF